MAERVIVMEKRPCAKGCGKMVDPRGAHKHEGTCPGPQGGGTPSKQKALNGRRSHKGRKGNRRGRSVKAVETRANACQICGLNVAERELAAAAIRGGMGFDTAVSFVRQARAAFGS